MKRKIVMVIMMFALTVLCLPVTMEAKTGKNTTDFVVERK